MKPWLKSLLIFVVVALSACQSPAVPTPRQQGTATAPAPTGQPGSTELAPTARPTEPLATSRPVQEIKSSRARAAAPTETPAGLPELVRGNNAFALDLYRALRSSEGNLFYSPYSISLALAMTYAGARGETEAGMARALHFTLDQASLHPAFNALDLELASRARPSEGMGGNGFELSIANSLWGQQGFDFEPPFLDTLAENYGAGLRAADFARAPEDARKAINDWVSDQTRNRIENLVPDGAITPLTRMVLANAIYFKAAWQYPFDEDATAPAPFHLLDGTQASVPMMKLSETYSYASGEGWQAVALPYEQGQLSMVVLLPAAGGFEVFEQGLDGARLQGILDGLRGRHLILSVPRFRVESSFALADPLSQLGMGAAFAPDQADFSGMTGGRDLYISDVVHKAFVSVDEAGTEAAAATAVMMAATAMESDEPLALAVDRPFLFLIVDQPTGAVLFLGRVLDPGG